MSQRKSSLAAELRPEWLRDINARLGAVQSAGSNGSGGGLEPHALSDTSIHTGTLSPGQAPWALTNSVAVIAGNGLTGGGTLTPDVTLNVGGGTLISIGADAVNLANGTAQYQVPVTGASPFTPAWTGLSDFAGNGLSFTAGVFAVGQGAGLTVDATTVALTLPGGLNATTTNNAGGNHTHAIATGAASTLTVATTNTTGTGTNLARADHTHAITSSSNPGAVASILASNSDGYLTLVRLVATERLRSPLLDTASGPLTLQPANNVVNLPAAVAIQTDNYASQLTGWRATYLGEADFRYLFVDELHAKAFIADLEQALAGGQIITKSVAMVAEAFTVPAAGGAATLRVRDLPSAQNMAVFESGDIVRLRTFSRADGELLIADAWGVVSSYADGSGANENTQTWTFTRSTAPNAGAMSAGTVIQPDSIVLDYGTAGNGFYEVNAIDGLRGLNSPYARVATWTGHPATGTALRSQFGNLRGVYGYADPVFGVAMGSATGANITVEATNGVRLRNGTTDKIVLDTAGDSYFAGVMTIGSAGEIRQGSVTSGAINDAWPLTNYTGLRIWRDGAIGRIGGYNINILQWGADTNGRLTAGAGDVILDASGITQLANTDESGSTEPPLTPLLPTINQRISIFDKASSTNWGYNSIFEGPLNYFYPGMEWLRIYVSSQHFVEWYTGSIPQNWHAWDSIIEMPANTISGNAGTVMRRRMIIKAPDLLLDTPTIAVAGVFSSNLVPNAASIRNLGSPGAPWLNIYVDNIVAGTITGASLSGQIWQHDATDMYIRSNSGSTRTLYVANPGAGLMHLDVEGNITLGGTVDGVDIAAHAGNANAHHARSHAITSTSDHTATGLTAGQVLRASGATTFAWAQLAHADLSGIGANTHAQIDSHISTADTHVAHSGVTITAGDGLTGGGTIAATRTLTLGTPGGLDAGTTNAVTSTSHTHAITANVAASALTVASTAAVGTSAALARADHIHAITTSSNPGAAASILATNSSGYLRLVRLGIGKDPTSPLDVSGAAAISGALSAGSGAITGALTVGGDLTVGSTVLQVSASGTRVGINRAADSQFDLDVAGAIRGQYLIGKHAIQLASAVGVWHFDGPAPYNLDFTGSNVSHTGVGGTESGGVIYRPGKFGKAVQLAEATTNHCTDPSSEGSDGWSAQYNGSGYLSGSQSTEYALYGSQSYKIVASQATWNGLYNAPHYQVSSSGATWNVGDTVTVSCYVRGTGSWRIVFEDNGQNLRGNVSVNLTAEWQRIVVTVTNATGYNYPTVTLAVFSVGAGTIYIDGVQIERKAYATPYCDGSLGAGHSWSGTAHASSSSRTGATLTYANNAGLNSDEGSIMMWARHAGMATGGMGLWGTGSNAQFDAYVNQVGSIYFRQSNTNQSVAGIQPQTWNHYAFTWSKSANTRKIFVNGVERSSRQFDAGASIGSTLFVGSLTAGAAYGTNGEIDEFTLLDYAADPKLIRAIYESDAPVFVESSVFHWRSPSRVPIWVDEFGLWARGVSGNEILGLYGGDPRNPTGNVTKSWGGITMEENDVVIGRAAQAAVHWDDSAGTMLIGRPSAANMLLSGGALRIRNGTTDKIVLDSGGNASFSGAITAESGNIAGVLSIGSSGGIYQGSGSFASPTTGLKIWNDGGVGRIGGYNGGVLQWGAETNGKLRAGAVLLDSTGIFIESISTADSLRGYKFVFDNMTHAGLFSNVSSGMVNVRLYANANESLQVVHNNKDAMLQIRSLAHPNNPATTTLSAGNSNVTAFIAAIALGTQAQIQSQAPDGYDFTGNFTLTGAFSSTSTVTATGFIGAWELFNEQSSTPSTPSSGTQARLYMKADKLIIQYNDGGTVRYKYLDLTGTGVTWVHTTTAP